MMKSNVHQSLLLLIFVFGVQCSPKRSEKTEVHIEPPEFSDPYLQSFRDKGIEFVVAERIDNKDIYSDTIHLDRDGNIIGITKFAHSERRSYDSLGFLIRIWVNTDFTEQFIAKYSVRQDTLVQSWRKSKSRDWQLSNDTATIPFQLKYYVVHNDKVVLEAGETEGFVDYVYEDKRLVRKQTDILEGNEFRPKVIAEYFYDATGGLTEIRRSSLFDLDWAETLFFSNGLLDSSRYTRWRSNADPVTERYHYRFLYY